MKQPIKAAWFGINAVLIGLASGALAQGSGIGPIMPQRLAEVNRITWGINQAALTPPSSANPTALPAAAQAQIDAMRISQESMSQLIAENDARNRAVNAIADSAQRQVAKQAAQQVTNDLAREAATRSLLRDLYGPDQLREQMTWFWFNHFNVQAGKRDIRSMVADYEDMLRAHALGKFRSLLEGTLRHPAMLRYLDNDQNAVGHINENYAREIMELHTMGVGSGYSQGDVQELARILTGVGVNTTPNIPRLAPPLQMFYVRQGLFEFNPARHDFGSKNFLGQTIAGSGFREVEQALDRIAAAPATARHISTQIATYFMGDNPAPAVIDRMVAAWQGSDGDIATVLRAMMQAPEYKASLGQAFKDPMHYVVSAVRYAYGDRVILNADPMIGWLNRMGEGLYNRQTPDGYPLSALAWSGPGQMEVRLEIAKTIGNGSAGLFHAREPGGEDQPAFPQLQNALYFGGLDRTLGPATRAALAQATSPQEWNMLFLASPDFMRR